MKKYFQTKVKYTIQKEDGTLKKVTNQFLVESDSFTLTEAILTKILSREVKGDFLILDIKRFDIDEIFYVDELVDKLPFFFTVKGNFKIDHGGNVMQKITTKSLIQESSVEKASKLMMQYNADLPNYEITSCFLTKVDKIILLPTKEEIEAYDLDENMRTIISSNEQN